MASNSKTLYLSVIIPAYNEEERLGRHLSTVISYLQSHFKNSFELIIVNDGSSDNTEQVVTKAIAGKTGLHLISYTPNRGKGYAVKAGVAKSKGDIVLFMDADLSTPLTEIPHILKLIEKTDIVIGSRGQSQAKIHTRPSMFRKFASLIFDQIKFIMVGLRGLRDTQCGFKAFQGSIARKLFSMSQVDRFMFDVEILYMAEQCKLKIVEMPVHWADMPGSKVKFIEGVINMFRDLWRIRQLHNKIPEIKSIVA
jgi:dolichyl-phosphate beta-glucosyltransferase